MCYAKQANKHLFPIHLQEAQAEAQTQPESQSRPQVNPSELAPRLCHLVRSEMGYGFNLHSDRSRPGQYIRSLDPGSPADRAGLQPQDRLIEVWSLCICNITQKCKVQHITCKCS